MATVSAAYTTLNQVLENDDAGQVMFQELFC
jgi:hypothetical protein